MSRRRVTFPHMGEYWIAFETLVELLGAQAVVPPRMTRHTLEAGAHVSPEFVCVPFKYNMGNFLEALEGGIDVIVQAGGGCRFGYYGEVQEAILRDMGYDFDLVNLVETTNLPMLVRELRRIQPGASYPRAVKAFLIAYRQAQAIEAVEDFVRKNVGFAVDRGAIDRVTARFLRELRGARTLRAVRDLRSTTLAALGAIPLAKPENPLRVGVVGELYVLMEPFANHNIERRLAESGVEVHRFVTLTSLIEHGLAGRTFVRKTIAAAGPWLEFHLGADATESVAKTWELMNEGFDGMVHVKPFGCMPEVSAMSVLQRISREYTFPIMFMSYDAQTAEAGVDTRVEAFCDMLQMRRRRQSGA
ncbi:MAG: hypothetical protein LLG08_00680 [Actinomycetia bacterium]|nr:hypothetical protein [Actinomycetes bacterium]